LDNPIFRTGLRFQPDRPDNSGLSRVKEKTHRGN